MTSVTALIYSYDIFGLREGNGKAAWAARGERLTERKLATTKFPCDMLPNRRSDKAAQALSLLHDLDARIQRKDMREEKGEQRARGFIRGVGNGTS